MLDRSEAEKTRDHVLKAIEHIGLSLRLVDGRLPDHTYEIMKRVAGTAIGELDDVYLSEIYKIYADLDRIAKP